VKFPVYRSYGLPGALAPEDSAILATALERANRELDPADYEALDFVARSLSKVPSHGTHPGIGAGATASPGAALQPEAALRFQLLTTPIAAKAIEDTVFYREARLLSRNEVGSDPNVFSIGLDEFHAGCAVRAHRFPHGMLTTATHDHKRGEDVRARLAVLSDAAESWARAAERWSAMNAPLRGAATGAPAPDPVDEFMLYQTLVGAWPLEPMQNGEARSTFWQRISGWWLKAMREAKRRTNWIARNDAYEEASLHFLTGLIDGAGRGAFEQDLCAFVDTIAASGAVNGLVLAFLRLTTPGIPDLYQGCEWWDFSLVDPDNRRRVDHAVRADALARSGTIIDALPAWRNGVIKQRLIATLLAHRHDRAAFYSSAGHQPLSATGARAAHVVAFERRSPAGHLVAIAARWPLSLAGGTLDVPHIPSAAWQDTRIELPRPGDYFDVLRGAPAALDAKLPVAHALRDLPVALYFADAP
jgi:(1->4)-alpha-D-glucan 1-alpha-D-glucosylmutase